MLSELSATAAVDCCPEMAQPFNNCPALMGNTLASSSASNVKLNTNKDASNGSVCKSGGSVRPPANGRRIGKGRNFRANVGQRYRQNRHESSVKNQIFPSAADDPSDGNERKGGNKRTTPNKQGTDEFEAGSVFNGGSKKQNISHLLNFQFEPRGSKEHGGQGWGHYRREKGHAVRAKYNKEQYLQANCQFVVRAGHDYTRHLDEADLIVDWDLIEQVHLRTLAKVPSCPICLFPPVAAKITRCGHVYCWTCMLHYLSLSDDDWRKCPICFETVRRQDLKSVVSLPWNEINVEDEIEMSLMRRDRNSLFAVAVDDYHPDINGKHPSFSQSLTSYSQLVLASPLETKDRILSREYRELLQLKEDLDGDPTICYVEEAMMYLNEREVCLSLDNIKMATDHRSRCPSSSSEGGSSVELESVIEQGSVIAQDLDLSSLPSCDVKEGVSVGGAKPKSRRGLPKETFYFYQSSDGQPIFLHAFNVEMLIAEYGSFEACPRKIKGKILEKESTSMTLALRNKLRYLRHLPVTCAFEVAEIALDVSLVSVEVLNQFAPEWNARKMLRDKRAKKEKQREKRIKREEDKLMQKFEGAKGLRIESEFHFPKVGENSDMLEPDGRRISESSATSGESSTFPTSGFRVDGDNEEVPSFSKMLRHGVARSQPVTASAVKKDPVSDPDPEGYVAPPPKQSIGDALACALEMAKDAAAEPEQVRGPRKKNKKMKGKTISLFS